MKTDLRKEWQGGRIKLIQENIGIQMRNIRRAKNGYPILKQIHPFQGERSEIVYCL